ncbi:hypothetical protein Hanom_Chr14g01250211 [Helianthus anomalus]
MMRAVVVEVRDVMALEEIRTLLDVRGYVENPLCYLGGLMCMIVFKEKRQALDFIEKEVASWNSVFTSAVLWKGQDLNYQRLVWLKVDGAPIHLRDEMLYERVVELFGKKIGEVEFSWLGPNNACGWAWVVADLGRMIDEEVVVVWKEKEYKVWVSEDHNRRLHSVIRGLGSQTPLAGSSCSFTGNGDEVEDGEIRVDMVESPAPVSTPVQATAGIVRELKKAETLVPVQAMTGSVRELEKAETLVNVHGNSEGHDTLGVVDPLVAQTPVNNNFSHVQQEGPKEGLILGQKNGPEVNEGLGPDPIITSRKRPRRIRSPELLSPNGNLFGDSDEVQRDQGM